MARPRERKSRSRPRIDDGEFWLEGILSVDIQEIAEAADVTGKPIIRIYDLETGKTSVLMLLDEFMPGEWSVFGD
jgi:hypothetical protein